MSRELDLEEFLIQSGSVSAPVFQPVDPYLQDAEQMYQAGMVVGKGDATFVVKDEIKQLGCKWHASRRVWVAPTPELVKQARAIVKRGPVQGVPVSGLNTGGGQPGPQAARHQSRAKFPKHLSPQFVAPPTIDIGPAVEPALNRRLLLIRLEELGVIELPEGVMQRALTDDLPEPQVVVDSFRKTDLAFDWETPAK